jgi:hypothetical protein
MALQKETDPKKYLILAVLFGVLFYQLFIGFF